MRSPLARVILIESGAAARGCSQGRVMSPRIAEDDSLVSDIDEAIDEELLSSGANAPFAEFVSIDDNVQTCELQSVAEIVTGAVWGDTEKEVGDETPEYSGENESVCRPANFAEALSGMETLRSFFCMKKTDKSLQFVQFV
ncbi:hypothetical protein HPB51_013066 [Rhipicephalus microplus]|uniref:Uncharacterized protein n=1 Tax=Rhipicephalus microplus TaxID=6941 RepID=A0A9J6F479_RHIMP|nr:hypothetical protein HPB51_013066 [Rhipicephalus microplus]